LDQIEHSQSLVPGFISRDERSKTTLNEIQHSDSPTKIQTGLMTCLERKEVDQPSMFINLRGDSFKRNGTVRRPLSYQPMDALDFLTYISVIYFRRCYGDLLIQSLVHSDHFLYITQLCLVVVVEFGLFDSLFLFSF
jgi:hypothetical protein